MPKRRYPEAIRVLSRDVRIHPEFEGALQITAKLESAAAYLEREGDPLIIEFFENKAG